MCLGVPGLLVDRADPADPLACGVVEFAGIRRQVCLACVPEVEPGDYVIVHAGIAISKVNPIEARRVFAFLQEIGEMDGWAPAGEKGTPS